MNTARNDSIRGSSNRESTPVLARHEILAAECASILLDPESPNWIALDERGLGILSLMDGTRTVEDAATEYAKKHGVELIRALQETTAIVEDARRHKFLSDTSVVFPPYRGRTDALLEEPLREFWIHTNNSCNLACTHCLVASGPDGDPGLSTETILDAISQARAQGATRFYFTGGEPLIRKDILRLIDGALEVESAELAILTNGLQFRGELLEGLRMRSIAGGVGSGMTRLRFQISLDGARPETNDPIRGAGSFARIIDGIKTAISSGLEATVSTVVTRTNVAELSEITSLIADCGGTSHHLLWMHRKGRAAGNEQTPTDSSPDIDALIAAVRCARKVGAARGVAIDNHEAMKVRMRALPGTKTDLSGAGVNTLCLYSDGCVYPSAAMVQIPELCCGSILELPLERIWKESAVTRAFREASLARKPFCPDCSLKFLCGGGDIEHAYFYADGETITAPAAAFAGPLPVSSVSSALAAHDPYCELHKAMIRDALTDIVQSRAALMRNDTGYRAPVVITGMSEGAVHCASEAAAAGPPDMHIRTTHSECVLSFDLDAPRKLVREFYGDAADEPKDDLCCPVKPDPEDLTHIPKDVVDRFYGCGSPVGDARIRPGEVTLDLGSGAGIDVFISAKKTGPTGRAHGVDMTDRMLAVAREQKTIVAANLGFDVVEFHKGFLEHVPLPDKAVDVVTSNCVINLSPDKPKVFSEIWRVLRDHGRMVISDIVSREEVPPWQRRDPRLWGECISGAMTEDELLALVERTGFYGVQVLKRSFWKDVEGYAFFSITLRGYKYAHVGDPVHAGHTATYLGPFKGIADEEGRWYPRNVAIGISVDTAAKLRSDPYRCHFRVVDAARDENSVACCAPNPQGSSSCC